MFVHIKGPALFPRVDNNTLQHLKVLLFHNLWIIFNQIWHKETLCGCKSCQFKWRAPSFSRGDNTVITIIYSPNFKNFFSISIKSFSTTLDTKQAWVTKSYDSLNEGPRPFPRRDDNEIAKIYQRNLKTVFSRTTGPISIKPGAMQCIFVWRGLNLSIWFSNEERMFFIFQCYGMLMTFSLRKCVHWLELFLWWGLWPMDSC